MFLLFIKRFEFNVYVYLIIYVLLKSLFKSHGSYVKEMEVVPDLLFLIVTYIREKRTIRTEKM